MTNTEIAAKVRRIKKLQAKADELNAEIKTVQDEIKAEMAVQNTEEIRAGGYKIRYAAVTSNRFDSTAFRKTYEALYQQFVKATTSHRFTIA